MPGPITSCARCGGELIPYPILRGRAGRCPQCSGIETDGEALSTIVGRDLVSLIMDRAAGQALGELACPDCGEKMRSIRVRRVEIDVCPNDEIVWMDGGEMARFRPGLNDQSPADPRTTAAGPRSAQLAAVLMDLFD